MLTQDLYQEILEKPAVKQGADTLYIVSGYASAGMVDRHLRDMIDKKKSISLHLIVGMVMSSGIAETNHEGLKHLGKPEILGHSFQCFYVTEGNRPVHAKTYAWFREGQPIAGFVSSANYTQTAYSNRQIEVSVSYDPVKLLEFYRSIEKHSVLCTYPDLGGLIVPDGKNVKTASISSPIRAKSSDAGTTPDNRDTLKISLLDNKGNLRDKSGLNWGQRGDREPNQAYIRLPTGGEMGEKVNDFFPAPGIHFTLRTDDNQVMICARHQAGGKGIQSTENNSLIGKYFRRRLNVPPGKLVTKEDLNTYGRTDVTFTKIDEENYLLDF